jgi:hypothetical protein
VVDEHAVAAARQVEGHVLVGLFARGAAVGVPDVDALAVLHQRPEPLSQAVDKLADPERELLVKVRRGPRRHRVAAGVVDVPALDLRVVDQFDVAGRLGPARGQRATARLETQAPRRSLGDGRREVPGGECPAFVGDCHRGVLTMVVDREVEPLRRLPSGEVLDADADHAGHRSGQGHGEHRTVERVAAPGDALGGRVGDKGAPLGVGPDVVRLRGVGDAYPWA